MKQQTKAGLPELPYAAWKETKLTLHLYTQIIGKIRLALSPKQNHWWHVPLYVSSRGLTTRAMPAVGQMLEIEFDLIDHSLMMRSSTGRTKAISLYDGLSVAQFYRAIMASLHQLGINVPLWARPYDPDRVGSDLAFAQDEQHASYQAGYVEKYWQILGWANAIFGEFAGRFIGKSSPVHLFWHSFDLAYTRFSGREAPLAGGSQVDREAYSHEVVSFGFWPGDENVPAPTFYSYTYPEPAGLPETALAPEAAFWADANGSHMALLGYDNLRQAKEPRQALLSFLQSAYLAGASTASWDLEALQHNSGRD